jgi:hypothetical protein
MMDKVLNNDFKQWVTLQSESLNLIGWAFSIFTCFVAFNEYDNKMILVILLGIIRTKFLDTKR